MKAAICCHCSFLDQSTMMGGSKAEKELLCFFMWLLAGSEVAPRVFYPPPICAVEGSTISLACTFSPAAPILRVLWCKDHLICHGSTPSVYSSDAPQHSRFRYLGDKTKNCTLQISNVRTSDGGTFRFRMEAKERKHHWTGRSGVNITVTDAVKMRVEELKEPHGVTLTCSANCSFHPLEVTWFKDGHALSSSGPILQLTADAKVSAKYRCALATNNVTLSEPYVWSGEDRTLHMVAMVTSLLAVLAVVAVTLVLCIIKSKRQSEAEAGCGRVPICCCYRKCSADEGARDQKCPDDVISSEQPRQQDARDGEDVSYAALHFKAKIPERAAEEAELAVVYSSVAVRG